MLLVEQAKGAYHTMTDASNASTKKIYIALHRAMRKRDRYRKLSRSNDQHAARYALDMYTLYINKVAFLAAYMPYAAQSLDYAARRPDKYEGDLWLLDRGGNKALSRLTKWRYEQWRKENL